MREIEGTVGVCTPEYWPRACVVALALSADELILGDSFKYSRQSYQNRARLRTPQGWHWISVPLRGGQHGQPISGVKIAYDTDWRGAHRRSLQSHYGTAPFFAHFRSDVFGLLDQAWPNLGDLTCETMLWTLRAFGAATSVERTSSWARRPGSVDHLAVQISSRSVVTLRESAKRDRRAFASVQVVDYDEAPRHQNFSGFVSGMSALDLLFNYGPEARAVILRDVVLRSRSDGG